MLDDIVQVEIETLVGEAAKIKLNGYRFVTMSCTASSETHCDILYHFDRELQLKHFRLTVPRHQPVPSISAVYFAAFLVENEIQDLFGLTFQGLAVDYERMLYLEPGTQTSPLYTYTTNSSAKDSQPAGTPGQENQA